ncbi:MAG: aspartate dehydrogenase [Lachnospiraceae bacterium]|nr:aspartate dehydrogenase [Lachnospiraceae bacterium]
MLPVLKCSICNGEQVAGFKEKKTGHFTEVAFIRSPQELEDFLRIYQLDGITKEY